MGPGPIFVSLYGHGSYDRTMARRLRVCDGGLIYHVLNRGAGKMRLFRDASDFLAFLKCVQDALKQDPIDICAYCLMPNHWHFVFWPKQDRLLSRFMQRLTTMHSRRWTEFHSLHGYGHIYQGRFTSFVTQDDR